MKTIYQRWLLTIAAGAAIASIVQTSANATTADEALTIADMTRSATQRIAVQQAMMALASESSDADGDGYPESPGMLAGTGPAGGGVIPLASAAPKDDSYGVKLGYCAWDNGTVNSSAGRITGSTNGYSAPVFAVVSSGIDNSFQTTCADIAAGSGAKGDDFVIAYNSTQLQMGVSGTLYFGDPVADVAALNALNTGNIKDGQTRLVKSTNSLYRWDAGGATWRSVGSLPWVVSGAGYVSNSQIGVQGGNAIGLANGAYVSRVGVEGGLNVISDGSGLQARNNGAVAVLNLNPLGGSVIAKGDLYARDLWASRGDGTGVVYLNGASNRYVYFNGTNYDMPGAPLTVNGSQVWTQGTLTNLNQLVNGPGYVNAAQAAAAAPVQSIFGRTGNVVMNGGDVANALGYVPTRSNGDPFSVGISDTRSTNFLPQDRGAGVNFDFKYNSADSLNDGGTYHGVMTFRPWGNATDFSGGPSRQLAFSDNGNLWVRTGSSGTSWGGWQRLMDASSYSFAAAMNQNVRTTDSPSFAGMTIAGNQALHAGNFSSYAMPLNGGVNVNFDIASNANTSNYYDAAIELRELNHGGAQSGAVSEAPRLSFHWSGRVASQLALATDGTIMVRDNPGSGFESFAARNITANGNLLSSGNLTVGGSQYMGTAGTGISVFPGASSDPYGAIAVTRPADGNAYSYFGMTRQGQIGVNIGVDTNNRFFIGSGASGFGNTNAPNRPFTVDMSGNVAAAGGVSVTGNTAAWNATTPGLGLGGIHLNVVNGQSNAGAAITFGAHDAAQSTAQAGIFTQTDGTYGTRMFLATTDSYATGAKTALLIDYTGMVNIVRSGLQIAGNTVIDSARNITGAEVYSTGWFRNSNASTGMYNQATGSRFYSENTSMWRIASDNGMRFYANDNSTLRGYVYHDGGGFGLLNNSGNWGVRVNLGGSNPGGTLYGTWDTSNLTVQGNQVWHAGNSNPVNKAGDTMTGDLNVPKLFANNSGTMAGAGNPFYDIGAGRIAAGKSIYSYGLICVGNNSGDCTGTGGSVISGSSMTIAGSNVLTAANISANVNGSMITSVRTDQNTDIGVAKMMRWKNYGNGHVIFDASQGTAPEGQAISNRDAQVAWSASYPTLMGWNGGTTYGVRVDSARVADVSTVAGTVNNDSASMAFHWSGQGGQPTWLWGGNDPSNAYVWNPSNFSVNYSNSAGSANTLASNSTISDINNNGWYRSNGNAGWYSTTYGGGIYMVDSSWVRAYNGKGLLTDGYLYAGTGLMIGGTVVIDSSRNVTANQISASSYIQPGAIASNGAGCGLAGAIGRDGGGNLFVCN